METHITRDCPKAESVCPLVGQCNFQVGDNIYSMMLISRTRKISPEEGNKLNVDLPFFGLKGRCCNFHFRTFSNDYDHVISQLNTKMLRVKKERTTRL